MRPTHRVADTSGDTRSHQTLYWERTRHVLRLRSALLEYVPVTARGRLGCLPRAALRRPAAVQTILAGTRTLRSTLSQPGLRVIVGARVLAEFGDGRHRYADAGDRRNYAGTSPITKASGTKKNVLARHARNDRLADALQRWAFASLRGSPGARAYYDA